MEMVGQETGVFEITITASGWSLKTLRFSTGLPDEMSGKVPEIGPKIPVFGAKFLS